MHPDLSIAVPKVAVGEIGICFLRQFHHDLAVQRSRGSHSFLKRVPNSRAIEVCVVDVLEHSYGAW